MIERAVEYFTESENEINQALKLASELKIGDKAGLEHLNNIRSGIQTILSQLTKSKTLPEISQFHAITAAIASYTQHGVELSGQHLLMKIHGHDVGGERYKIE